jgi:nucleotide-binding universal stress UspA family protein
MTRSVLVGVDVSPESARAAALGVALARSADTPCRLVHAVPDLRRMGITGRVPLQQARHDIRKQLEASLRDAVPPEILARLHVAVGRAGVVLADEAARSGAWIVVLGGKQRGAVARGVAGSTAHHLIRRLDVPVLIAGPSERPISRILVAVDLSPAAAATLREAERAASLFGAALRVMHIVEPIKFPMVVPITRDDAEFARESQRRFDLLMRHHVGGTIGAEGVVRAGVAEERIAAEAREWGADAVVLGSHGKGWADRLLIGSVTEHLLNQLPATLLVVPASARERVPVRRRRRRVARIVI